MIKRKPFISSIAYISVLLLLNFIGLFINVDFIALSTYVVFLLQIYRRNRQMILKYLFMFVMFSYHIVSVLIADNSDIYFFNLQKQSYHTGAFIPLLLSYVIFFCTLYCLESRQSDDNEIESNTPVKVRILALSERQKIQFTSFLLLAGIALMLYRIRNVGFYSMGGIDRFTYRANNFSALDEKFYTYISWLLPLPLIGNDFKNKKIGIAFFVMYCVYVIWVGDKFGSLFMAFYFFVLVFWVTKKLNKKVLGRIMLFSGVILGVLMAFIAFQVMYERGSWDEVITYFNNRLTGGQSDLWWCVFSQDKLGGFRPIEFIKDEISAVISKPSNVMEYNFGIYKMMRVTAPDWVVNNYLLRGARFAASTQASLFYYFGYGGLYIGSYLMGKMCHFAVSKAVLAYRNADLLKSVLYTMLVSKSIQIMSMSDITMFGNVTTILGIITLIGIRQLELSRVRNKMS